MEPAGQRDTRFHELRRTTDTLTLPQDVLIKVVSERLGRSRYHPPRRAATASATAA
jgi:hypothetical protein